MTLSDDERRRIEDEMRQARAVGRVPPSGPVGAQWWRVLVPSRDLICTLRAHPWRIAAVVTFIAWLVSALFFMLVLLVVAVIGAIAFVQRSKDKIRGVAWVLIAAGFVLAVLTPFYVRAEYQLRVETWSRSYPTWPVPVPASPWPGFVVAGVLVAFGILLLAIRRPAR